MACARRRLLSLCVNGSADWRLAAISAQISFHRCRCAASAIASACSAEMSPGAMLACGICSSSGGLGAFTSRSEEHTSELQSLMHIVCRLLLEKKKKQQHKRQT